MVVRLFASFGKLCGCTYVVEMVLLCDWLLLLIGDFGCGLICYI